MLEKVFKKYVKECKKTKNLQLEVEGITFCNFYKRLPCKYQSSETKYVNDKFLHYCTHEK